VPGHQTTEDQTRESPVPNPKVAGALSPGSRWPSMDHLIAELAILTRIPGWPIFPRISRRAGFELSRSREIAAGPGQLVCRLSIDDVHNAT